MALVARLLADSPGTRRRVLVLVAAAATLLRLLYVLEVHDNPYWLTPLVDAADYHARAMQVMRGEGLGSEVYYKAPAYPFLVGQVYRIVGPRLEAIYVLQMIGGVATAVLVTLLALRWFGPASALVGGLACALYAGMPYFENQLLIESSALFFSVVAAALLFARARPPVWMDVAAGLAAGVALQLRPVNVALVVALLVAVGLQRVAWTVRLRRATCIVVPVLLLLGPTLRHNRVATGRVVPISVNGGINFYIGNNPDYDATVAVRPGLRWEELTNRFGSLDDPVNWQRGYYRAAFDFARERPADYAALQFKKLLLFWNRHEIDRNQDSSAMWAGSRVLRFGGVRWILLAPLGLVGLVVARRAWRRLPLHALVGLQMLGVIAFFVTSRYRLAVVPWLAVAAGVAVTALVGALRRGPRAIAFWGGAFTAALLLVIPDWTGTATLNFGRPDFDRAEVLARLGDREGALRAYERAVEQHPDDPDVRFRYGQQLERFGRSDSALAEYRRAAELAPWSYKPLLSSGTTLLRAGDLEGAWSDFVEAARRGDPHGKALYDQGIVRETQERFDEALELYRASLELPDNASERVERHLGAARCLMRLGRTEEAALEFESAERETSDPLRVPVERARSWLGAGDPRAASKALAAVPATSRDARVFAIRSRIAYALGRGDEALADARAAVAADSSSSRHRRWLELLESGGVAADSAASAP